MINLIHSSNVSYHDSFAIDEMMFSIFVITQRFFETKLKTRAFVKNHENDQLTTSLFVSTRTFKRRRLMIILRLFQSFFTRDSFENDDDVEKFSNKNVTSFDELSLFLFQNENEFVFEQFNNFDDFDFDIDVERFFEFSKIVFIIEKTEIAKTLHVNFSTNKF